VTSDFNIYPTGGLNYLLKLCQQRGFKFHKVLFSEGILIYELFKILSHNLLNSLLLMMSFRINWSELIKFMLVQKLLCKHIFQVTLVPFLVLLLNILLVLPWVEILSQMECAPDSLDSNGCAL